MRTFRTKTTTLALCLFAMLAVPVFLFGQGLPAAQLWGRVVDADTQADVSDALVHLEGMTLRQDAITDSRGLFRFISIYLGAYTLTVEADGYEPERVVIDHYTQSGNRSLTGTNTHVIRLKRRERTSTEEKGAITSVRQLRIPRKARSAFEKGAIELYENQQPQQSLQHFQEALRLYSDYDEAYVQLALANLQLGELQQAESVLTKAVEVYPENASAQALLGKIYLQQGKETEAFAALQKALQVNESSWNAHVDLAKIFRKRGELDQAFQHAHRARELKDDSITVRLVYYNVLVMREDYAAALKELEEFLELFPESESAGPLRANRAKLEAAVASREEN